MIGNPHRHWSAPPVTDHSCHSLTRSCRLQVVDSIRGNLVDEFTAHKPHGWKPDMARQQAVIAKYVNGSGYVELPFEATGTPYAGLILGGTPLSNERTAPKNISCAAPCTQALCHGQQH